MIVGIVKSIENESRSVYVKFRKKYFLSTFFSFFSQITKSGTDSSNDVIMTHFIAHLKE